MPANFMGEVRVFGENLSKPAPLHSAHHCTCVCRATVERADSDMEEKMDSRSSGSASGFGSSFGFGGSDENGDEDMKKFSGFFRRKWEGSNFVLNFCEGLKKNPKGLESIFFNYYF